MNQEDEKFFEALAGGKSEFTNYHVELAKAESSVASRSAKPVAKKPVLEKADEDFEGQLMIDVYQKGEELVVESAVAGIDPESIDINVTRDSITIKGSRERQEEVQNDEYFYQECYWGKFSRSVILPYEIDPERAQASFKNGILTVRLPKASTERTKKLRVTPR